MFSSRFFWKLYASYAALVVATALFIGVLVHQRLQASLIQNVEETLKGATVMLEPLAAEASRGVSRAEIQSRVEELGRETAIRITLVQPDGNVIADSDQDPEQMENHGDRPEILAALSEGSGISRRFSRTLEDSLLYVARAVRSDGGLVGVVRASVRLSAVQARLAQMRATIAVGATVGVLAALVVGLFVAQRITQPLTEMTRVADSMRSGDHAPRVRVKGRDELSRLGDTLNRMASELEQRISTLAHNSSQLEAIIGGMQEGVLAVDREDRVILSNRAGRRLLGVREADLAGQPLWKIVRMPDLIDLIASVRASKRPDNDDIVLHRGPEETIVDARATPFGSAEQQGIVVVLYDITELRKLERVRQDFVANVSHELKTPLTTIGGYVETLLDGALDERENQLRFLQRIEVQVGRLADLVNDLLSLARIESPTTTVTISEVDWRTIVDAVTRTRGDSLARKRLSCEVRQVEEPLFVLGEPEAMTQVLDNLLDNAIRYTPEGGSISIRIERDSARGCLHVEDTGIGISEVDQERIFERFYRADPARSGDERGTGLGLAIVKHLMHNMRGSVEVASQPGRGSRFTVCLPLAFR